MKQTNKHLWLFAVLTLCMLCLAGCNRTLLPTADAPAADLAPVVPPEAVPAAQEAQAPAEEIRTQPSSPKPETPELPAAPARELSYPMLLGGAEQTVYLEVSDEEILLWDSAAGGQLVAAAKYAQTMPGAQDALQGCDFTDLDEDGSSELTASFSFPDGTSASLVWFYTSGGFVYNPEFSVLPGEASAAGEA